MIIFIPTPYICCWVPFNVKGQLFYLPLISSNMLFSHYLRVLKRLLNCYCVKYIVSLRNYVMEQIEWMIGKFSSFNCYLKCILYIWMKYINIYDKISCSFIVKLGSGSISGQFNSGWRAIMFFFYTFQPALPLMQKADSCLLKSSIASFASLSYSHHAKSKEQNNCLFYV